MVFLIQNSQNCDTVALQLKIDELVRATSGADDSLLDLEKLDEKHLGEKRQEYLHMAEKARNELGRRKAQDATQTA